MQLYWYVLYNVTIVTRIVVFINLHEIKRARIVSFELPPPFSRRGVVFAIFYDVLIMITLIASTL